MNKNGGVRSRGGLIVRICIVKIIFGVKGKNRIGSLLSHLGILGYEFEKIISAGKMSKIWSWYKNMVIRVKTHRYNSITWIAFYEAFAPLQWAHIPRHQTIG